MSLVLSLVKPKLSSHPPLCSFRSSKSYLWGLVRDKLHSLSASSSINVLDAACHSLITRHIFPASWNYCGLDISRSRLTKAFSIKSPNDILFLADLTKKLPHQLMFDVVVSLNTLSHLPPDSQLVALENLIACCNTSSYFIINTSVDPFLPEITHHLLRNFDSVQPIYINSYQSVKDEESGLVTSDNVQRLVSVNEESLPNDASLHKGVLFICSRDSLSISTSSVPLSSFFSSKKIHQLNHIPSVSLVVFSSDSNLLSQLLSSPHQSYVVISSRLYSSPLFLPFLRSLDSATISYAVLDDSIVPPPSGKTTFCIGLEAEWTQNEAQDRIYLNRLREFSGVKICLCFVKTRFDSMLSRSLIFSDY